MLNATLDLQEKTEAKYLERLADAASNSISCFTEYMTPDEVPGEHHEFMCTHLEAIERRELLRATFSMPPGHAKTKFCSRMYPAWYLGRNPLHKYMQGGHSQAFCENEFGRQVRDIIRDPKYARVFPDVALNPRSTASGNWRLNNRRGGYVTKGVGQKIAGYRGHCGGVDDPFGSREDAESPATQKKTVDWFFADFMTRLLPESPAFVVATRWCNEDLIGYIETLNKQGKGIPWLIINLNGIIEDEWEMAHDPMGRDIGESLWGDYYTPAVLMDFKATLPDRDWWSLYKGRPRNVEGNVVKTAWLKRFRSLPNDVRDPDGRLQERNVRSVTISVDTANKTTKRSAYSAAGVFIEDIGGRHYLAEVAREKVEYTGLQVFIEDLAERWRARYPYAAGSIIVEDRGNGTAYIQARKGLAPYPIIPIEPERDEGKEFRFDAATPMIESGQLLFPHDDINPPWWADYLDEILSFPNSKYKDQVDMTSQYCNRQLARGRGGTRKLRAGAKIRGMTA